MEYMSLFKNIKNHSALLSAIAPFAFFLAGYIVSNLIMGNITHQTPQLIGLHLDEAISQASQINIGIQLAGQKECAGIPAGTIVSQKPIAGRLIKAQQSIFVVTTTLPPVYKAPKLLGHNINDLKKSENLKIKTYDLQWPTSAGTCIAQSPEAGSVIADKKIIALIAKPQENICIMPKLISQDANKVENFLKNYGLNVELFYENKKLIALPKIAMTVIAQKPAEGTFIILRDGGVIQLEVSTT